MEAKSFTIIDSEGNASDIDSEDISQEYESDEDRDEDEDEDDAVARILEEFGESSPVNSSSPCHSIPLPSGEFYIHDVEEDEEHEMDPDDVTDDEFGDEVAPLKETFQDVTILQPIIQPTVTIDTIEDSPELQGITNLLELDEPDLSGTIRTTPIAKPFVFDKDYTEYLKPYTGETDRAFTIRKTITDTIAQPVYKLTTSQIVKLGQVWANKAVTNVAYSPDLERVLEQIFARGRV